MSHRVFRCHADAAVHLDRFLAHLACRAADLQLRAAVDRRVVDLVVERRRRVQAHAACQLERDVHVRRALRQRLEGLERHPELLARLEVFGRQFHRAFHRADSLGALSRLREDVRVGDCVGLIAVGQFDRRGVGEAHPGGTAIVVGAETVDGHTRRVGVDDEQSDGSVGAAGADDELLRHVTREDRVLHPVESDAVACAGRRGGDCRCGPTIFGFCVCVSEQQPPLRYLCQQTGTAVAGCDLVDDDARQQRAVQQWLGCEAATNLAHQCADLDRPCTGAACVLAERQPEDADLGKRFPNRRRPACVGLRHGADLLDVITLEHAADGVAQQ